MDDLVEFTRMHLGPGIPVQLKEVDVVQLCNEIVDELRISHSERPIILQGPTSLAAVIDGPRVGQMISNLLGNASSMVMRVRPSTLPYKAIPKR